MYAYVFANFISCQASVLSDIPMGLTARLFVDVKLTKIFNISLLQNSLTMLS